MEGCDLSNADLSHKNLSGANLEGANFEGANLTHAWLNEANLTGANFEDAELYWINLIGATITGANLEDANLEGAYLCNIVGSPSGECEDTGYIEEGFDYCIDVGANLVASPCRDAVPILDTLPSEIANNLSGIIGQGVATTNQNGNWVGSLSGLGGGNGYWMLSNVNACFNYNCAEN